MSVTNYTTFCGQIVHENRAGVEHYYVPDTLGSTAALTDTAGNVTDTFEYWPYGEVRTRTGTTATPFQFVGTLGYYVDALSRLYVRARYYLANNARWLTVDPLWPDQKSYGYVDDAPLAGSDPSGEVACSVTISASTAGSGCGSALMGNKWLLEAGESDGWIVQQVTHAPYSKNCIGSKGSPVNTYAKYWEAWKVKGGRVFDCWGKDMTMELYHDLYSLSDEGSCTYGAMFIIGYYAFVPSSISMKGFTCGKAPVGGKRLWISARMPLWFSFLKVKKTHTLESFWGCCNDDLRDLCNKSTPYCYGPHYPGIAVGTC